MLIHWFGHACFGLTTNAGTTLITDPFNDKVGYPIPDVRADGVTVSHEHDDHNATEWVKDNPVIIRGSGDHQVKEVKVTGIASFHDNEQGAKRGPNTIFTYEVDGLRLCHLGDLGHLLSPEQVKAIGPVDVLFIPVGGVYTIDAQGAKQVITQLNPTTTIPMHYKTPSVIYGLAPVDDFLKIAGQNVVKVGSSQWQVTKETLPPLVIVLLNYEN